MEVKRWALWALAWGWTAGAAWPPVPERFPVPVWEPEGVTQGTLTLLPASEGFFEHIPLRSLPGLAPLILANGVRFFATQIQATRHLRRAALDWGQETALVQLSDTDIDFLRVASAQARWLVPQTEFWAPSSSYYEGPLELSTLEQVRFLRQPLQSNGGTLLAQFTASANWLSTADIQLPIWITQYRGVPLNFVSTGTNWKQSEPVELVDLDQDEAWVVSRRQIDQVRPGDEVVIYRVHRDCFQFQQPGLWWLRPTGSIPGTKVASYKIRRASQGPQALEEIRRWYGGSLKPAAETLWSRCAQRLVRTKDRVIDELGLYFSFN